MLRSQFVFAALVGTFAALPQVTNSAPPETSSAPRSAGATAGGSGALLGSDTLLGSTVREQQLIAGLIQAQVDAALQRGQTTLAADPASVNQNLKLLFHQVLAAPELSSGQRAALRLRLEAALHESGRREAQREQRELEIQQARAAAQDRARVANRLDTQQQRIKQLMERLDSLLDEGRYDLADLVASQVDTDRSAETAVTGVSALVNVRLAGAAREALAARIRRQQGVVRALEQVELAGIALPGDEPIVYPQAERWQELSARRAKYARTDLHDSKPAEARLSRALSEPTNFDFADVSLRDAVAYLKDLHGIEIQFDDKALEDAGIDLDAPITRRLSGISLRSAIRLLLGSLDLTYAIDNEVLLITTPDSAAHRVVTKVYPVGELVLPISTPNFSGGFGPLGGFGGQNRGGQQGAGNASTMFNPMGMGQNQNNNALGQGVF